jgi:peptide/nickel transport system permease protein
VAVVAPVEQPRVTPFGRMAGGLAVLREVARRPAGLFGLIVVGGLFFLAIFAPLIAPYDPAEQDIPNRLQGPSWDHLLGTDQLGRDLLSRLIFGVRVALSVALPGVAAALVIGLVLGLIAGYIGGRTDNATIVMMDTLQAFPAVILALVFLALLGASRTSVIIVIAVAFAPNYARVTRALVLTTKQNQFVEAARSLGAGNSRIVGIHILPNVMGPLFILLAMDLPAAITIEAGLSFLGLGVPPPTPSWGVMLQDGFDRVRDVAWPIIWAGLTLMVVTLGCTFLGETLRDVADPRLAGVRRWRRP